MRFVVEHKTSLQSITPGSVYWRRLLIDVQVDYYYDGAEALAKRFDGILFDVLGKPLSGRSCRRRSRTESTSRRPASSTRTSATPTNRPTSSKSVVSTKSSQTQTATTSGRPSCASNPSATRPTWTFGRPRRPFERLSDSTSIHATQIRASNGTEHVSYFEVCTEHTIDRRSGSLQDSRARARGAWAARPGLLTQSSLRCFRSCQRRYYYRYVLKARPLVEKAEALLFGTEHPPRARSVVEDRWRSRSCA